MARQLDMVYGPPGTGKTTHLLNIVDQALQDGMHPDRIGFFSFTRAAATEAVQRACDRFNLQRDDFTWFRTLHSTAYHMLALNRDQVMQPDNYAEFASAYGYPFKATYGVDSERVPLQGAEGDLCMSVFAVARARQTTVEQVWRGLHSPRVSLEQVVLFADRLTDYKLQVERHDFSDFLDLPTAQLPLDLVIVDETQDLTRQQWGFLRRTFADADKVVAAGDDDQAIYEWAGAAVDVFLQGFAGARRLVLPHSYRLPRAIHALAADIAARITHRQAKLFTPRDAAGVVDYVQHSEEARLDDGRTHMLLGRTGSQLTDLRRMCRDQGVVYRMRAGDGQHGWSNDTVSVRAIRDFEALRKGETLGHKRFKAMASVMRGVQLTDPNMRGSIGWGHVAWGFEGTPSWMDAPFTIGDDEREYVRRLRRAGHSLSAPGKVEIGTIHSVKGAEADHVLLLPDVGATVRDAMTHNPDAEHRVWYVAVTRAREALTIVDPRSPNHYSVT